MVSPSHMLRQLGMHPKYKGYICIRLILEHLCKDPRLLYRLSTDVYPQVYTSLNISKSCMDKDIRFAINRTWLYGDQQELEHLFGYYGTTIPTKLEFISILSHAIMDKTHGQEVK